MEDGPAFKRWSIIYGIFSERIELIYQCLSSPRSHTMPSVTSNSSAYGGIPAHVFVKGTMMTTTASSVTSDSSSHCAIPARLLGESVRMEAFARYIWSIDDLERDRLPNHSMLLKLVHECIVNDWRTCLNILLRKLIIKFDGYMADQHFHTAFEIACHLDDIIAWSAHDYFLRTTFGDTRGQYLDKIIVTLAEQKKARYALMLLLSHPRCIEMASSKYRYDFFQKLSCSLIFQWPRTIHLYAR